jgi:hypothetical protein
MGKIWGLGDDEGPTERNMLFADPMRCGDRGLRHRCDIGVMSI